MAGFSLGGDEKGEVGRTFTWTVFEGIFHERLKDETGDENFSGGCGGGDASL